MCWLCKKSQKKKGEKRETCCDKREHIIFQNSTQLNLSNYRLLGPTSLLNVKATDAHPTDGDGLAAFVGLSEELNSIRFRIRCPNPSSETVLMLDRLPMCIGTVGALKNFAGSGISCPRRDWRPGHTANKRTPQLALLTFSYKFRAFSLICLGRAHISSFGPNLASKFRVA